MRCLGFARPDLPCPFEGQYLMAFTPDAEVKGTFTDDPKKALRFMSKAAALECWQTSIGTRPDGQPDRPLTAFTVEVLPA